MVTIKLKSSDEHYTFDIDYKDFLEKFASMDCIEEDDFFAGPLFAVKKNDIVLFYDTDKRIEFDPEYI